MSGQQFAIDRSELLREFDEGLEALVTTENMVAEWLDERGDSLGKADYDEVVFPPYEWPGDDRLIKAEALEPIIMSRTESPDLARAIRFRRGRQSAMFATQAKPAPWVTERTTQVFGGAQAQYEISVYSEFFTDFDRFEGMVDRLYEEIRLIGPFREAGVAGKLRLVGYYAASPGPSGHFQTVTSGKTVKERRVLGDQGTARARLKTLLNNAIPALILIDSPVAGGAGGSLQPGLPPWPAWASLGSMAKTATWEEVAIHELAHGFGLSDEYIDRDMASRPEKPVRYGNVSDASTAADLTWNDLAQLPDATSLPTHNDSGAAVGGTDSSPAVAAYSGAYYTDLNWRPSINCRMRNYDPGDFCPVCSRVIGRLYDIP